MNFRIVILYAVVAIPPWFLDEIPVGSGGMGDFLLAFMELSGTLLGFVIGGLAIFTTFGGTLINNMKKTGHYRCLVNNFYVTGASLFLCMLFSIVCYFIPRLFIWKVGCSILLMSLVSLVMTGRRFYTVMRFIGKPEGNPNVLD
ncbi:MAG: hypothetical protein OXF42_05085 [Candidatus Dadabacteria bacterium]|nr:hypothetical protein [Candidatus Dadabacteria bacterium]